MFGCVWLLFVGVDQITSIINYTGTASVDQGRNTGFITGFNDVARALNIDRKVQLLRPLTNSRYWRRS